MDVAVQMLDGPSGDELRDLRRWLGEEAELRGKVRLVERKPREGELGELVDALVVSLGPGGAAAFASVLVSWIRHRTGTARIVVRRPDGHEVEVSADRVRTMNAADLQAMVEDVSRSVGGGESVADGGRDAQGQA